MTGRKRPTVRCSLRPFARFAYLVFFCSALGQWSWLAPPSVAQSVRGETVASAEEAARVEDAKPLAYRRIFVPAENLEAWPREGDKFLPIESRDFESWLAASNGDAEQGQPSATIREAEYTARFNDGQLVAGRGQWKIDLRGDTPAFLPLRPMSLVPRDARWQDSPQRPVRLGTWGRSGHPAADFGLEVTNPGTLEFAWSAQTKTIREGVEIPWRLPPATITKVVLNLPEGKEPRIDGGIVLKSSRVSLDVSDAVNRWEWELVCNSSLGAVLQVVDTRPVAKDIAPDTSLHDDVVYHLSQRGLDIAATWSLKQTGGEQPQELAMLTPRDVQLVSLTAAGQELSWRAMDGEKTDAVQIVFKLPERADRSLLRIALHASSPLVLDKTWRLPKLRPEGVFWTSGKTELVVTGELEMRGLEAVGCVPTGVSDTASDADHKQSWQLAVYSPTAEIDVAIARRQPVARLRMGSLLAMADPDITGRLVTEWRVTQGKIHGFSGELAEGWIVEAVETVPADALSEWFIDRRDGRQSIEIQLAHAASAARDVSVIVRGRLPRSKFNDQISSRAMRMVTWRDAQVNQHVLAFETTEPLAVEPIGGLPRIAVESIDGRELLLDADTSPNSVFDLSQANEATGVALTKQRGQFLVDIRLDASLIGQELLQKYHLLVTPTSNRVDQLLIDTTSPLGDGVRWADAASGAPLSAERLPTENLSTEDLPAGGERWRVRLPRPTADPVEIVATATAPWPQRSPLPLLTMPEAVEQSGCVFVRGGLDSSPVLEPHGMTAISLPAEPAGETSTDLQPIRAAYRFDPADCLDSARAPQLWITPADKRDFSSLIARRTVLESYFSLNGDASHRATYFLNNEGSAPFDLRLPANAVLQSIFIDGQAAKQTVARASAAQTLTRLSIPKGSSTVSICFDTRQAPLSVGSKLVPPLVESSTPILAGEWNIRLPEELSVSSVEPISWRQRLFGPLGRPEGSRLFRPHQASDWANLINTITGSSVAAESSSEPLAGWHTHQITFAANEPSPVLVSHPSATSAWAVSLFLVSLVVGVLVRRRRSEWFIALLAVAAVLAFLLPNLFVSLAAGAVLGLLLSMLVPRPRQYADEFGASTHWHRFSTIGATLVVVVGVLSNLAYGQPDDKSETSGETAPSHIHRVLIPVDAEGRQVGTKYYVSEHFARALLRAATKETSTGGQWLLKDAAYTGELRETADSAGVVAGEWMLTCNVEVLARDTSIVLPLVREEAAWPAVAMVDGVPLPIEWRDDGLTCSITIAEPGRYSVAISATPQTSIVQEQNVVRLSVLPQPGASFRLNTPGELTGLTAKGATPNPVSQGSSVFECELDGSGRLELQWPAINGAATDGKGRRTTQLEWLQLGVDRVELVTKYIFEGNTTQAREVVVAFDPAWELMQEGDSSHQGDVTDDSANRKSIRLKLPVEDAERQEIVLRWRLVDGRSLGRLLLPSIELVSHSVTQCWRGISSAASIECAVADAAVSSGTAAEFLAMWGNADDAVAPQIVLGNIRATDRWSVTTKPRQTESEIAEVLHVAGKSDQLLVVFQADVTPGTSHRFQFPLMVPAEVSIDEIALTQADHRVPVRWARVSEDRVNIFFTKELTEKFELVLRGTMQAGDRAVALPQIAAAGSIGVTTVQFYRDEDALLSVSGLPAVNETLDAPLDSPPTSWTARHVAGYRLDKSAAANIRLEVSPNPIELTGNSLTTLARSSDGWIASFQGDFSVVKGTLDSLRLHVPFSGSGTPTLDSSLPASITPISGDEQGPMYSIRFSESIPMGTAVKVRVDTPVTFAPSAVSVPMIESTPSIRGSRYVQVPSSLEDQSVVWDVAGARKAVVPSKLWPTSSIVTGVDSFEVEATPFQVTLQPLVRTLQSSRVRLADTVVSIDPRGGQLMTTRFVVEPEGLLDCTLRLPEKHQLVGVRLAGLPALFRRVGETDWQVTLGPPQLPTILEVISRSGEPATSPGHSEIRRPALLAGGESIPVEINLWSLGSPLASPKPTIAETAEATAGEQAVLRFDRLLSIAESATPAAVESPAPDGDNWFRPWAGLLRSLRSEALETVARPDSRQLVSQVSHPLEEQLGAASARLDSWIKQCTENLNGSKSVDPPTALHDDDFTTMPNNAKSLERWVYCVTDGGLDHLTVDHASSTATTWQVQSLGLVAVVSLSITAILLMRRQAAWDLFYQWPHAVGFLVGIAYWAWMQPSWFGLLISAASVALACQSGWPGRAIRMDASTVLRASRPK